MILFWPSSVVLRVGKSSRKERPVFLFVSVFPWDSPEVISRREKKAYLSAVELQIS
jgi:hypothetical protein